MCTYHCIQHSTHDNQRISIKFNVLYSFYKLSSTFRYIDALKLICINLIIVYTKLLCMCACQMQIKTTYVLIMAGKLTGSSGFPQDVHSALWRHLPAFVQSCRIRHFDACFVTSTSMSLCFQVVSIVS